MAIRPTTHVSPSAPLLARLMHYLAPDLNGGCWLWAGSLTSGYGVLNFRGRRQRAHRLMWEIANGPIPPDRELCHKCDVRACFRPDHLFVGTRSDNMLDASRKGRLRIPNLAGEDCATATISWEAARAIRKDTGAIIDIAVRHGVSVSIASRIRRNKTWRIERDPAELDRQFAETVR